MLNNWSGAGRVANDLKLQKTQSGKTVLRFSVAINKANAKKLKQENQPYTNYISCVAWGNTADMIAQYFQKGNPIELTGSIETRNYEDPNFHGRKVYVTEVYVSQVGFPVREQQQTQPVVQQNSFSTVDDLIEVAPDDLPF